MVGHQALTCLASKPQSFTEGKKTRKSGPFSYHTPFLPIPVSTQSEEPIPGPADEAVTTSCPSVSLLLENIHAGEQTLQSVHR